jgi:hypothetical protein
MLVMVIAEILTLTKKQKLIDWYNNLDKTKYIIILTTLYLSIALVKMIPFFVIVSVCFIYEDFYKLIKNVKLPEWKDKVIYSVIFSISFLTFFTKEFSLPVGFNRYPVKEAEFIKINNLKGKLFANFNYGSYLSYKLYPNNLIYMDGRYEEVYPDYLLIMQRDFFMKNSNWLQAISIYPPDIILLEKD